MRSSIFALRLAGDELQAQMFGQASRPMNSLVLAGDQRVLDHRARRGDRRHAQRTDMHERAGHQLEVFHHAAGEDQALRRVFRIDERPGVADLVEAFLVEGLRGQVRLVGNSPGVTMIERMRISYFGPAGTIFSSTAGCGRPIRPTRSVAQ